jgi:G3E family GTPase
MTERDGRLGLTLLGGYLGAGKTTWARHQIHAGAFGPGLHVIVNEAAETPVDDVLLGRDGQGLTLLAGGCCCCAARQELVAALRVLCDRRSRDGGAGSLRHVLLETSGHADPAAILGAIRDDPVLVHHLRVRETVVLVDALHAPAQLVHEPLGRRQIASADRLILTKADRADAAGLARLRATLALLNPHAPLSAARLGEEHPLAPEALAEALPLELPPLPEEDGRGPILPARVAIPEGLDWASFAVWLSALLHARGDDLVRVKGVVRTPGGRLLLQAVRKVVQPPELLPDRPGEAADNQLVFIGRGCGAEDLARSMRHFLDLPAEPAPC